MSLLDFIKKRKQNIKSTSASENNSLEKIRIDRPNDQPPLPIIGKSHRVAGVSYYEKNILKLASENPNYKLKKDELISMDLIDVCIHKFTFSYDIAELEQDPTNMHDPNAIKVLVGGQLVGYIKAGSCAHVNKLINEKRIEKVLCRISGGPYVQVFSDIDDISEKEKLCYEKVTDDGYRVELRIITKEK